MADGSAYTIVGVYNGKSEVIDSADTEKEAEYLVREYRMAYGQSWRIYWHAA
jgi:hypothetical protein